MSLFKHAMVSGINDALVDRGVVAWPDESVGFEVCSKLASDLSGPDMLPEGGLSPESAIMIGQQLKAASDNLIAQGYGPSASSLLRTKQASAMDFTDRAAMLAEACMSKAAADASLTDVGTNTAESAAHDDQHAALDLRNRAVNKYLMGVGRTAFPNGGVVGQQMVYPGGPSQAGRNSLTSLDKQANETTRNALAAALAAAGEGVRDIPDTQALAQIPFNTRDHRTTGQKLRGGVSAVGDALMGYGRSAATNPFGAANRPGGFMPGVKGVGGALLKHPGTHAAALAAALYGGHKLHQRMGQGDMPHPDEIEESPEAMEALKQANEDMAASDLEGMGAAGDMTPGPTVGALQRVLMGLKGLGRKIPGFRPSPEAQVAMGGLGEAGAPGMEVMAHIIDTVKTAADAEDILQQILHHQGAAGELASPEMVAAIEQLLAEEGQGGEMGMEGMKQGSDDASSRMDRVRSAPKRLRDFMEAHPKTRIGAKATGAAAALATAAYAGKKGLDAYRARHPKEAPAAEAPASEEKKAASLLHYLKAAADGSLTDVGQNTAESAAEHDQVAELDLKNRAANAYLAGVGNTGLPGGKQVFDISKVPGGEAVSNSVTEGTKSAEVAYVNSFRKIASEMGPHLPATMGRDEKVAHLQTMLGLPPNERVGYLKALRAG